MVDNEETSNSGFTIGIIGPDSDTEVRVGFQNDGPSWFPFLPVEPGPSLHDSEATSAGVPPYLGPTTGLPLTVADVSSLPVQPLTLPDVGVPVHLQPTQTRPLHVAVGYPASNPHWPEHLTCSPLGDEEIDEIPLLDLPLPGDGQAQLYPDSYPSFSPNQNHLPINYEFLSPSSQGLGTPYYTPPDLFERSLSPYSTGSPSPSSSFASTLVTTPDDDFNPFVMGYPYPDYDGTGPERGRSVRGRHGPSAPSSRMPSPYEQPPRRLSRSPHGPRGSGSHLAVSGSALMEENPSALSRRHTISAGSRPRRYPSRPISYHQSTNSYDSTGPGVSVVTGGMTLLTLGSDTVLPLPDVYGPSALPPPSPSGPTVASEAIIAACTVRRQRKAKFKCDICPQNFTAKHNLINHKKAHSGIKDQVCVRCGNAFTASGTLTRHNKTCKGRQLKESGQ
ncbi:hypothetical protein EST38_g8022 [Candolleomyces aberdarensis]|uniref:C2H2-type domain-containing protein n=1 Tax=Candolleomyces aberdarensis TaxID=2316362 RepID=A0A4Q2DDP5_9AGAR|nr:hypothetical protein EST38_g8022 [Candolleomyces aberdarensis]